MARVIVGGKGVPVDRGGDVSGREGEVSGREDL